MPADTKKTVVLIFFIGSLNVQHMNFPKERKDKKDTKSNNLALNSTAQQNK